MAERIIQVGFKMAESKKNIIKSRASAQGKDMQTLFDEMIDRYFADNPITDSEQAIVESAQSADNDTPE